ncbi:hypothetical protein HaLaN_31342 [Haematococcus lacustris]|uniref:Uncharacterized protein n=1 Tax=Haematococcus lacustris TaxID=44745 RepID=A0A6A0AHE4_HAELA|nr:hypothetical protein HaLaN_31342 [Haematococcus lacustris]
MLAMQAVRAVVAVITLAITHDPPAGAAAAFKPTIVAVFFGVLTPTCMQLRSVTWVLIYDLTATCVALACQVALYARVPLTTALARCLVPVLLAGCITIAWDCYWRRWYQRQRQEKSSITSAVTMRNASGPGSSSSHAHKAAPCWLDDPTCTTAANRSTGHQA